MKSLHKLTSNAPLESWNPPELEAESAPQSKAARKEKALTIFQNEHESTENQNTKTEKSAMYPQGANINVAAWQPNPLGYQAENINNNEEWSFIEVSDTPFNKSWKAGGSKNFPENPGDRFVSENEIPMLLERTRLQAEEIILAAQAEADNILLQAESEIEEQKKEGYQQARNEVRAEIEDAVNAVKKMVEEVEAWKTELLSGSEQILVEMIKDISRKMFGDGIRLDAQTLHTNLNRVMENARGLGTLKVFLNPNDARLLDQSWSEQQMLVLGEQVKIVPSGNVLPGGCLIKGNIGTVDGRVETQLDTILKSLDEPNPLAE